MYLHTGLNVRNEFPKKTKKSFSSTRTRFSLCMLSDSPKNSVTVLPGDIILTKFWDVVVGL